MKDKIIEILENNRHDRNGVIYDSMIPDIAEEILALVYTDSKLANAYSELAGLFNKLSQERRSSQWQPGVLEEEDDHVCCGDNCEVCRQIRIDLGWQSTGDEPV